MAVCKWPEVPEVSRCCHWTSWLSSCHGPMADHKLQIIGQLLITIIVMLEILAGRYFGPLLKICHLVEFTLAVEPVFSHNDSHNKMASQHCHRLNIQHCM